jgi:hypothetical protein
VTHLLCAVIVPELPRNSSQFGIRGRFFASGELYARAQDTPRAGPALDRAESIYRSLSNTGGQIEVAILRAHAAEWGDHLREASELATKAIETARSADSLNQTISWLLVLAGIEYDRANLPRTGLRDNYNHFYG